MIIVLILVSAVVADRLHILTLEGGASTSAPQACITTLLHSKVIRITRVVIVGIVVF